MTEDLPLPYAPQPSILLAANKDAQFLASTQSTLLDLAESALGGHRVARYAPEVGALAAALFYGATIIAASKTLGEEYCALTTATRDASGRFAPVSLRRRAVEVALRVLPPYALQCLGRQQQGRGAVARRQRQRQTNGGDLPSAAPSWAAWVAGWAPRAATLQRIVLWFGAAHTALFLLRGDYSDLTRRLLRTRLLANQPLKGRDVRCVRACASAVAVGGCRRTSACPSSPSPSLSLLVLPVLPSFSSSPPHLPATASSACSLFSSSPSRRAVAQWDGSPPHTHAAAARATRPRAA